MSVMGILQQLPIKTNVSDVQEKYRTANSRASYNESKNGYWHPIRMPRSLPPCIRKSIHCVPKFFRTQNGKQAET